MAKIGYARCSTMAQDLTAQRQALTALGVPADRVYLDKGLTGTSRARPGLDQALAAVREGDTLTVTKLDRLARSVPDALDILGQLSARGVRFALGGSTYDWNDPFARMFLSILAVIAEFEANLIRQRTREGMAIASQNGKLRGKQPSLKPAQDREIRRMHDSGDYNIADIAGLFGISRPTVYRSLERTTVLPRSPPTPGPPPTSPGTTTSWPAPRETTRRPTVPPSRTGRHDRRRRGAGTTGQGGGLFDVRPAGRVRGEAARPPPQGPAAVPAARRCRLRLREPAVAAPGRQDAARDRQ